MSSTRALALLLALVLGPSCAGSALPGDRTPPDAGATASDAAGRRDAAASDADFAGDSGPSSLSDAPGVSVPDAGAPLAGVAEDSCFDFTDDDSDGAIDCRDLGCEVAPICCAVGSSAPACCQGGPAGGMTAGGCSAGSPVGCGDATGPFGARAPNIVAGIVRDDACGATSVTGLEPGGDEDSDGGVFVGDLIDPTVARIRLTATLGARPGTSALDSIAVGVTAQTDIGGRVLPLVAVLLSSSDADLRVLVGDAVVSATPLSSIGSDFACGASELTVVLELSPDGTFSASVVHPDTGLTLPLASGEVPPARSARAVIFGRGALPGTDGPGAWLTSLGIDRQVCSATNPGRDELPTLGGGWTISPRSVGRVSVLPGAGLAAVLVDGRIYAGTIDPVAGLVIPDPGVANAIVRPTGAYAGGVSDPELVIDGGRLFLLFAGRATPGGPDSIYVVEFGSLDLADALGAPLSLLTAAAINAPFGDVMEFPVGPDPVRSVDSPSYFTHGTRNYLLVRVHTDAGTELRILERVGGLAASGVADVTEPSGVMRAESPGTTAFRLHANRSGSASAFDRDEVGGAQAIDLGDGVVRVLYAGRNGTRWAIGLIVSTDLVHFDFAGTGGPPVLTGDGVGFDALGVLHPEPAAEITAPGVAELRLWYTGTDGLRTRVGLASQAIAVLGGTP